MGEDICLQPALWLPEQRSAKLCLKLCAPYVVGLWGPMAFMNERTFPVWCGSVGTGGVYE